MRKIHLNKHGEISFIPNLCSFFDDFNLFTTKTETIDEHLERLITLIERLSLLKFTINLQKSSFIIDTHTSPIKILGYEIFLNRLYVPKEKYANIINILNPPKNVTTLQRIIGSLNYFRALLPAHCLRALNVLSSKIVKNKLMMRELVL